MESNQSFPLPHWIESWVETAGADILRSNPGQLGIMQLVLELARLNYSHGPVAERGGPFAAAVVHQNTGKIISVGVNRVVPLNTSTAHAEVIALARAQQTIGSFSLKEIIDAADDQHTRRPYTLYTSAQMCAMCLGAVCWSGVGEVVFGAKAEDTEALTGFDEGPIHPSWRQELESRDITVIGPVLEEQAKAVLKGYAQAEGTIYAG